MAGKNKNKIEMKYSGKLMRHWYWCTVLPMFLFGMTAAVLYFDTKAGLVAAGSTIAILLMTFLLDYFYRPRVLTELIDFANHYRGVEKELLKELAVPFGIAQIDGKMLWMNDLLQEMTGKQESYHKNITTLLPKLSANCFPVESEEKVEEIEVDSKKYRVVMRKISLNELINQLDGVEKDTDDLYVVGLYFFDITELDHLRIENAEQKPVVGWLYIDNYEEVMESVEDVRRSMLEVLVNRRIIKYVTSMGGLVKKIEKDKFLVAINRKGLKAMQNDRFSILEEVKTVNIGNTTGMTISIGMGDTGYDYNQNCEAGRVAIEMALARGGDQAIIKENEKIIYYGGKTQHAERNTRVRARVKAQALRELFLSKERVIVMGHKITDVDSLGSAIGVCRAAKQVGKPAHIVLGDQGSNIKPWVKCLEEMAGSDEKLFLTHEQAIELTNHNTVVVVVDTNRPSMVECEEILYLTRTTVVIDHHRQSADCIENASLSYVEPSASSASEMISELLQYYDDGIKLKVAEADCMYAGIVVDTNNFMAKTGIRTFEAAAFLRRNGADMTRVRKMFRNDMNTYKARAEAVRNAETFMNSYAISEIPAEGLDNPTVVGAQAANELLNIIGVKASFVLTKYNKKVFISARAIDEVNVQIIMERLGGGGHMNIAGAQMEGLECDEVRIRLKEVLTQMTKEGAI